MTKWPSGRMRNILTATWQGQCGNNRSSRNPIRRTAAQTLRSQQGQLMVVLLFQCIFVQALYSFYIRIDHYIKPITVFGSIFEKFCTLLTVCKLLDDRESFSKDRNKNTQNCKLNAPRWAPVVVGIQIYISV